jgi:hypothetical protein
LYGSGALDRIRTPCIAESDVTGAQDAGSVELPVKAAACLLQVKQQSIGAMEPSAAQYDGRRMNARYFECTVFPQLENAAQSISPRVDRDLGKRLGVDAIPELETGPLWNQAGIESRRSRTLEPNKGRGMHGYISAARRRLRYL